ncbi:MAG TPA: SpoIIE family protein phosphatase [Solirubrobacteraceae bacterium]|jgi:PAS domain S-box-containing protein|nr:SpoIIE family protein phosphatase [Solirubrobacteraceae bacterium]
MTDGSGLTRPAGVSLVDALRQSGRVGEDLLRVDWSQTAIGPPTVWPRELATAVRILLTSRFSMWMAWGPELTFFCNDSYRRDTLATKYPWALGRPASEVWAEIWEDIGPRINAVLTTGEATWDESLLLFLERSGYAEETYHTFSYSPLTDDVGRIAGMLCVVTEETDRVVGERRMATLRELGSEPTTGRSEREYLQAASRHLAVNTASLPFTAIYLFDTDGAAELVAATGIEPGHAAAPKTIRPTADRPVWPIQKLANGEQVVIHELDAAFDDLPTGVWTEPPNTAIALPLQQPVRAERPYGFLVIGANRYRPLDEDYRSFLNLLAAQLASGVASAQAYDAERRRAEELAELDRAKTAFFTNISHELRTPLTLLLGPAEDALAEPESEVSGRERQRMEVVARNGARLLRLVNGLLDFSRIEAGQHRGSFEPVDLAAYTSELANMFESTIAGAGLAFEIDCAPLDEPVHVDREMWARIVMNLISNALKYTVSGTIRVHLGRHDEMARLMVSDTGIGIAAEEQPRLFDRFHRVPDAQGRTFEGSGIGLALVAELAALHGGHPDVESEPGTGSTFTVEIPFGSGHLPADQLAAVPSTPSIGREAAGMLGAAGRWGPSSDDRAEDGAIAPTSPDVSDRAPRVLVVDDNSDMREYVSGLLAERYRIETAADGAEALELALSDPPDLVLSDVMMPRLDGYGLLAALREDPRTMAVPFVMLSARAGEDGVIEGLEAGADDYLAKPFSARELLARVHANLELDRARRIRDKLEHSQRMQNQAERLSRVGSWEIDLESGAIRGSEQLLDMLALTAEELAEMTHVELIARVFHSSERNRVRAAVDAAIQESQPVELEAQLVSADGDERWVLLRGDVAVDDAGLKTTLLGFVQDTTERRRAAEAVAAAAAAREVAAREHQIADGLQRRMLPFELIRSPHLEVGTYYRAGEEGMRVGGDWYDVIDLGGGRTALTIGDVTGHGVPAAGLMGQLRAAVRAYSRLDVPPGDLLELLDALVRELGNRQLVTCIYGVYDPLQAEFRYANAGHLPPVTALPGATAGQRLPDPSSPPLGAASGGYSDHTVSLPPGAVIVLYTDGLVERRDYALDDGIDRLAAHLRADTRSMTDVTSELAETLARDSTEDDIAILAARASHDPSQRLAVLGLEPKAEAVRHARRFVSETLGDWSIESALIADAVLIASELVTNAIVHGKPPIQMRLHTAGHDVTVEVDDGDRAIPRKLRVGPDASHGRGLAIVASLSARWAARPNENGKTVWSTLRPVSPDGG